MKDLTTGFVEFARTGVKSWFLRLYYTLSAYIPRRIPTTEAEFEYMKSVFIKYYGLEDDPNTWYTVCGQLTAVPAAKIRKSYGSTVNAAKRLKTNALIHNKKILEGQKINDRLEAATKKIAEDLEREEKLKEELRNGAEGIHILPRDNLSGNPTGRESLR